jgi:putative glutamine amidotransferase
MDGAWPTIGVTQGFTDYGDYQGLSLTRPLVAAGAVPFIVPLLEDEASRARALDRIDGLLLGYGRDIEPQHYGGRPDPSNTLFAPRRDALELPLCREAIERGLPVLGICRGMQVINVALGGTLYADRSDFPGGGAEHPGAEWEAWRRLVEAVLDDREPAPHPSHPITIAAGSRLGGALGERAVVNSYHHQAVRDLGDGVEAVAWAPDGVVEAIEVPGAEAPVLGVQWELQQEWQSDPRSLQVFTEFVAAAAERAWTGDPAT